jgi:C4-dicarboxylate-specific signal transduction histidine kinase
MTAGAVAALCVGVLLLGLAGIFFIIWFFFKKSRQEDDAIRQWQQDMMLRIDEAFPSLERLLRDGAQIPTPVAKSEAAAGDFAQYQDEADAALQRELAASNAANDTASSAASSAASNAASSAGKADLTGTLFSGGGFVS